MSDDNNPKSTEGSEKAAAGQQPVQPGMKIKRIYLKDLSFETPMGVEAFTANRQPKIDQELNVQVNSFEDGHHEVVLLMTITARIDDRVAFLVEVKQAGLFVLSGLEGPQLSQAINTSCPQVLFPYAREVIDSTIVRGSFPPLMLPPINFDAVFAQAVQQMRQQKSDSAEGQQEDA